MAEPRHDADNTLTEFDFEVLASLRESTTRDGLTVGSVRYRLKLEVSQTWKLQRSLERLYDHGELERNRTGRSSGEWRYFVYGSHLLPAGDGVNIDDERVKRFETDAMQKKLSELFSVVPDRYDHHDIVTRSRGRVGLKPSLPIAGRATGAW